MPHDLFISYAHQGDNTSREAVTALVARLHAELEADFRRRFNRDLEIFFDKEDIQDFDHWQVRCHRASRDSRFFIACLSRSYLRSDACRWEWEEWCRHELEHGLVGQGAASLWFVKLEDLDAAEDAALLRRWKGDLLQRFHIQCHEWRHDDHGNFLDAAARSELQQLTEHVAQRLRLLTLDRARRGNLPWPNANFVGREPELASLRAALLDAPEPSPAGIHGVGGMGKTALAQAFAYKEADAFPGGCWLLSCEGRDRLLSVFRTLVSELEIELTDEEKLDDTRAVRRVFDVLHARGPALFLLDNVDRPALLAQEQMKLLADQPWARVLYTTRLAPDEFARAGANIRPLDLDRLPENQAVDLMRRYQPGQAFASSEHEAAAREIVRELSGLTLAVETAAVYLGQCDPRVAEPQYAVDVRNYLNKLREDLKTGGSEGVMSQLREVTATLRPTLARLDAPARTVLQIASLLAPDGVALPWVRAIAGQSHPELASDAAIGESDPWTQLIRGLIGMRLFQPTAESRVVAIHRILQRVLESELPEDRVLLRGSLMPVIQEACSTSTYLHTYPEHRWLVPVIEATANAWLDRVEHGESELAVDAVFVSNAASGPLMDCAAWWRAESILRRALTVAEFNLENSSRQAHVTRSNLASLLHYTNRLAEAEPLMRNVVEHFDQYHEPKDPAGAAPLNNLAALLEITNRLPEAEEIYRRALAVDRKNLGSESPVIAVRLNNLALLLRTAGRTVESEPLFREAVAIDEMFFGTQHPTYARHLYNLATLFQETNRLGEAEPLLRKSISILEQTLGKQSPELANALTGLGALLRHTGRISEAEPLIKQALAMLENTLSLEHPKLGPVLTQLASLYRDSGRAVSAEALLRRALEIDENSFGADNPSVALRLKNLGTMLCLVGRPDEAIPLLKRALQIDVKNLGAEHPSHQLLRDVLGHLQGEGRQTDKPNNQREDMKPNNPKVPVIIKDEPRTYWVDLEVLCIGHVPNAIDSFRLQNAQAAEWAAPRLSQLVTPPAVEALVHRARAHLSKVNADSAPQPFDVGPLGGWQVCATVFPSAVDADFLRRCPNGRVEDYLANCRKAFQSSCSVWSDVDYAHWILLLNPAERDASVHLFTQWSLVSFGQYLEESGGKMGGPPFIAPIELLRDAVPTFLQMMMSLDVNATKPAKPWWKFW